MTLFVVGPSPSFPVNVDEALLAFKIAHDLACILCVCEMVHQLEWPDVPRPQYAESTGSSLATKKQMLPWELLLSHATL